MTDRLVEIIIENDLRPISGLYSTNQWSCPWTKNKQVRPTGAFSSTKWAFRGKCETFHTQKCETFHIFNNKNILPLIYTWRLQMRNLIYVWNYREWGGAQIYF